MDRLGKGLRVVGTAPGGVVEAIETTCGAPALGVQWHPELELSDISDSLFRWVVDAGLRRARLGAERAAVTMGA
jgi:putative glutamine amidotransferase